MSSPKLEEFLARLYTDAALREQFMRDPAAIASAAHLSTDEVSAMCKLDVVGLQMAATSFAYKRKARQHKSRSIFSRLWEGSRKL